MAGKDYGGKCTVALSSGERFALRAAVKHRPAGRSAKSITNQDASVDRTVELGPRAAEISFADRGLDYEKLMQSERFDVTFVEDFTGITHLYSQAFMEGEPTIDRGTGEVTGLTIVSESYVKKGG